MSVSAVAFLRPSTGKCLRAAAGGTTGLLTVRIKSRTATVHLQAVVRTLQYEQRRHQHQSAADGTQDGRARSEQPKPSFRQFAGRALGVSLRNLVVALSPRGIRQAYSENPALTTMNIVLLVFTFVFSVVAVRAYINTFYSAELSRYPEPVANTLRRALYHTNVKPDPELALKFYKKAMTQCTEIGLDPFSDEVLGIRIQVAYWLQKIGSYRAAVDVLESVLGDCRKWIDAMEQSVKDGKVDSKGRYAGDSPMVAPPTSETGSEAKAKTSAIGESNSETLWRKRQRLLSKAVSISVKLGELDASNPDKAHEHLVWAVETSLREFQRRNADGPRPGEADWLSAEELGGALESLGRHYESRSQFRYAIPLFFQALRLCESPCHRPVIMNNLAASFAQNPAPAPGAGEVSEGLGEMLNMAMPTTRQDSLEAGLNWARNAYVHAKDVKGDDRTAECDEACAVALCNWGDVAALLGKTDLARRKYAECIEMSGKLEFQEGVVQAREGLAKLATVQTSK